MMATKSLFNGFSLRVINSKRGGLTFIGRRFPTNYIVRGHDVADVNVTRNVSKLNKFEGMEDEGELAITDSRQDTGYVEIRTTTSRKLSL